MSNKKRKNKNKNKKRNKKFIEVRGCDCPFCKFEVIQSSISEQNECYYADDDYEPDRHRDVIDILWHHKVFRNGDAYREFDPKWPYPEWLMSSIYQDVRKEHNGPIVFAVDCMDMFKSKIDKEVVVEMSTACHDSILKVIEDKKEK